MPAFPAFSPDEVRALVTFTAQLAQPVQSKSDDLTDRARAAALYTENCASCHGPMGAGDGPAAAPLARRPTDFRARQPAADRAARVVGEGVPGTAMPGWKSKLSDSDRQLLVEFVRAFYAQPALK
jgi:mono/diheme cytochrome c family protein